MIAVVLAAALLLPAAPAAPPPDTQAVQAARDYWANSTRAMHRASCTAYENKPKRYARAFKQGLRSQGTTRYGTRQLWRAWRNVLDNRCDRFNTYDSRKKKR